MSRETFLGMVKLIGTGILLGIGVFLTQNQLDFKTLMHGSIKPKVKVLDAFQTVSLAEMIQLFHGKETLILDVREKQYFDYAHIKGAVNLEPENLTTMPDETFKRLKNASAVVVYCGEMSALSYQVAKLLVDKGLKNINVYSGGWSEWKLCRLPIDSSPDK